VKKKNIIGLILARKGSKRLKSKNLKKINGKSLTEITIKFAKKLKFLTNVILSTDDRKILNLSKKNKIMSPGLRPATLSDSKSSSEKAAFHAIKWYEEKFGKVDGICLLQPTTPFRDISKFKKAIKIFLAKDKTVISVSKIDKNPNIYFINEKKISYRKSNKKNNSFFYIDGSLYLISRKVFFREKTFVPKKFVKLINDKIKYSIDIDFEKDLKLARLLTNENF
jgi:CMP-N-acetylneuraminic acid synthetase